MVFLKNEVTSPFIDVGDYTYEAAAILGTSTKKDTVNQALAETVALERRRSHLQRLAEGGLEDLADAELMAEAWR